MELSKDEIIRMALELVKTHGLRMCDENGETHGEELYCVGVEDIAEIIKQVAAHEREACAKVVNDDRGLSDDDAIRLMRAIRARGE